MNLDEILKHEKTLDPQEWQAMRGLGHRLVKNFFDRLLPRMGANFYSRLLAFIRGKKSFVRVCPYHLCLLEGLAATTHHGAISLLQEIAPNTKIDATKRFIDNGKIIVSAGISAGIDMSLYVVAKLLGKEQAWETARYMEYDWHP